MSFGGISVWQLILILVVFLLTVIAAPILHAHRSRHANDDKTDEGRENDDSAGKPTTNNLEP